MAENQSEVARLLQEIDLQYEAADRALNGAALGISLHEFMIARTERIEGIRQELEKLVGPDEATKLVVQQMDKSSDRTKES